MKERYPELRWRTIATTLAIGFLMVFLRLGWVQIVRGGEVRTINVTVGQRK